MLKHATTLVSLFCAALLACDGSMDMDIDMPSVSEVDLAEGMSLPEVALVGVTVNPDDNRRFVMDAAFGLYEVSPSGDVDEVLRMADFPVPQVGIIGSFTDITALGNDQFALTATNNGFLLDLQQNTLTQHFCYLPDPSAAVTQVTRSLAFDRAAGLLYAQPQTFDNVSGTVMESLVGQFDRGTGEDLAWFSLSDPDYSAGAIALEASQVLLMGSGSEVKRYQVSTGAFTPVTDLAEHGVSDIVGMAIDETAGTLLVIDGPSARLVELLLPE